MLCNAKASIIMNFVVDTAKYHLKQSGSLDPQIFFLREKNKYNSLIRVDETKIFKGSSIIIDQTEVDMSDKTFQVDLEGYLYIMNSSSFEDDQMIDNFIRIFLAANDIDLVAFVMTGYRKKVLREEKGKKDLNTDAEATRVLHATYGLRGKKDLYSMTTPIVEVGKKKPTEDNPSDIHMTLTPWAKCTEEVYSRLESIANKNGGALWN